MVQEHGTAWRERSTSCWYEEFTCLIRVLTVKTSKRVDRLRRLSSSIPSYLWTVKVRLLHWNYKNCDRRRVVFPRLGGVCRIVSVYRKGEHCVCVNRLWTSCFFVVCSFGGYPSACWGPCCFEPVGGFSLYRGIAAKIFVAYLWCAFFVLWSRYLAVFGCFWLCALWLGTFPEI